MKTVLILTDLSRKSLNAAEAGLMIAMQTGAELMLFYSCTNVPVISYYPGVPGMIEDQNWLDESEEQLKNLIAHLYDFGLRMYPDEPVPVMHYEVGEGELAANITGVVEKCGAELIVMGGRTGSRLGDFIFGGDTNSVANYSGKPVLIVAQKKPLRKIDKVIFASNFNETDVSAIEWLMEYGKRCQYQLDIVHVNLLGEPKKAVNISVVNFIKNLAEKNYPIVRFTEVWGKDLIRRLHTQCKDTETDVLALTHQQHSFFVRMLKEGIVKKTIFNQRLPILVLPSK